MAEQIEPLQQEVKENIPKEPVSIKGILTGLFAAFIYSFTQPFLKILYKHNTTITPFEVVFWKSISMMFFNAIFIKLNGQFILNIPPKYQKLILLRSLAGFIGVSGLFNSILYLPISTANVIFFTGPLIAAILAYFTIKEKITIFDVMCLVLAFFGVILINNPFEASNSVVSQNFKIIGSAYALFGAVGAASAWLCMRIMKDVHYTISPFYFSLGSTFFSPFFALAQRSNSDAAPGVYDWTTIGCIAAASFFSFIGQIYQSKAYQMEKAARVAVTNYIQIVMAFLWDIFAFNATFTWQEIVGAVLIVGSTFIVSLLKAFGVIK